MKIELLSDFPMSEDTCGSATGKRYREWFEAIEGQGLQEKRREAIQWLYDQTGRGKDTWWATTIWVEYTRDKQLISPKDGLLEGYNICVTKSIRAGASILYAAWTSRDANGWLCGEDAVEGQTTLDPDGNEIGWLRLRPNKDVRMSWRTHGVPHATQVDVVFVEKDGKTGITLNHTRIQTRDEADGARNAWAAALLALKNHLEA